MKKIFKKIGESIKWLWYGLFWGMKSTEEEVFTQVGTETPVGTTINQEVHSNRISKDLLNARVTKQVEELRHRTYYVDREAKQMEYFSPTLVIKRDKQDSKFVQYYNEENLPIITIQNNFIDTKGVLESLKEVDRIGDKVGHWIKVTRSNTFLPRYRIEDFTTRLVVRELEENKLHLLDFYVSKYPINEELQSKGFVREIERIKNEQFRSDVLDIKSVEFMTLHAYKFDDMFQFKYVNPIYEGIVEYDGHYVITFKAEVDINGEDFIKIFKSESMDKKYKTKAKKDVVYDFPSLEMPEEFVCEECGKVVTYNPTEIDEMEPTSDPTGTNNTEYFDIQMAEQTYGKKLCGDCLQKYIKELQQEIKETRGE